ncbi:hypothetical protein J437_LFUL010230 [Ladona fulva]|uniref:Uncharacterized protein n=1 Tax=Ladona fulva TaxID=123851 RepID=A0A8K0KEF6_LADFU|nr:hypothetical protein J437_LFUL010230 [Ladona fulva]
MFVRQVAISIHKTALDDVSFPSIFLFDACPHSQERNFTDQKKDVYFDAFRRILSPRYPSFTNHLPPFPVFWGRMNEDEQQQISLFLFAVHARVMVADEAEIVEVDEFSVVVRTQRRAEVRRSLQNMNGRYRKSLPRID